MLQNLILWWVKMYNIILHATDLSSEHFHMCERSVEFANYFKAKLYLLHVIEPPASLQLAQGLGFAEFDRPVSVKLDAQVVMATIGDALNIPLEQQLVEIGSIKQHVLLQLQSLGAELLIIGHHTASNIPAFFESTAHMLVKSSACNILLL